MNKKRVAHLYGTDQMTEAMFKARPNAFILLSLAGIPLSGKKVLELFCGTGYLSNELASKGAEVLGVDISENAISYANQHAHERAGFIVGDIEELMPDPQFDIVLIPFGLQYVRSPEQILEKAIRSLSPSGMRLVLLADAYKVGMAQAFLGIPSQLIDVIKLGRANGVSYPEIFRLIRESFAGLSIFNLSEWKELEEIRNPLSHYSMQRLVAKYGGQYTGIGNSYFLAKFQL